MKALVLLVFATVPPCVYVVVRSAHGPSLAAGIAPFTICAAPVLTFLLRRDWRRAVVVGGGFALHGGNSYIVQLISIDPYRSEVGVLNAGGWLDRIAANLQTYFLHEVPRVLDPDHNFLNPLWVDPPLVVVLAISLITRVRRAEPVGVYLGTYLGPHLLWPQVWSDLRFLVDVIPLLVFGIVDGLLAQDLSNEWVL